MEEIWKDVENYEGYYQISNLGRLRSLDRVIINSRPSYNGGTKQRRKGKIMKLVVDANGYQLGQMKKDRKKVIRIHRMVASAFLDKTPERDEVNHIDGNKQNNIVTNLEWVNHSENGLHAFRTGLNRQRKGKDNKSSIGVLQYDLNGNFIRSFESQKSTMLFGFHGSAVSRCCNGKMKIHHGYIWVKAS